MGKLADMVMRDNNHKIDKMDSDDINEKEVSKSLCCEGFNAKGWSCKNEPQHRQSFYRHHLSLVRSDKKAAEAAATTTTSTTRHGSRARAGKKTSSYSYNPYEFYYYSGFGPQWGKRRGSGRKGERNKNNNVVARDNPTMMMECNNIIAETPNSDANTTKSMVLMDNNEDELDYVEDNDEEDDGANEDDNEKKKNEETCEGMVIEITDVKRKIMSTMWDGYVIISRVGVVQCKCFVIIVFCCCRLCSCLMFYFNIIVRVCLNFGIFKVMKII
ncbi:PREDICTED: uncharacterized protein LOC109339902 [Lupinus angustifolius]|uniref:uncharacterized protein LOC109339902 n=1 Tax=Lupinus angustifolius TaxID=3871 RepID=UPI00092F365F|nr:PREDICTED: uncharacterized protein LOC109339902 [Lupinus angustifolius]